MEDKQTADKELKILIIDDNVDYAESLAEALSLYSCIPYVAHSAKEVRHIAGANVFDYAFVDMKMPGVNGIEILEELRRAQPDLPACFITGCSVPDILDMTIGNERIKVLTSAMDIPDLMYEIQSSEDKNVIHIKAHGETQFKALHEAFAGASIDYGQFVCQELNKVNWDQLKQKDITLVECGGGPMRVVEILFEARLNNYKKPIVLVEYGNISGACDDTDGEFFNTECLLKPVDPETIINKLKQFREINKD